eukprot:3582855-Rhodomonas_salina.1
MSAWDSAWHHTIIQYQTARSGCTARLRSVGASHLSVLDIARASTRHLYQAAQPSTSGREAVPLRAPRTGPRTRPF